MNTHPTQMQVGGWGLWPMIVPIGVGVVVDVVVVAIAYVFLVWVCFFGIGVCVVGGPLFLST